MPPDLWRYLAFACWATAAVLFVVSVVDAWRLPALETRRGAHRRRRRFRTGGPAHSMPRGWFEDVRTPEGRRARRRMLVSGALCVALLFAGLLALAAAAT